VAKYTLHGWQDAIRGEPNEKKVKNEWLHLLKVIDKNPIKPLI